MMKKGRAAPGLSRQPLLERVAAHDVPLPYAAQLEDFVLPQTDDIVRAARALAAY